MDQVKIDVCINYFGKYWQTMVTLKSLLKFSGKHIDNIYFIEENKQPEKFDFSKFQKSLGYEKLIYFKPKYHLWINPFDKERSKSDEDYRLSLRYQFAFEKSEKKFLFITHNDVLYTDDVIGYMLDNIGGYLGIGEIGQCWNCPVYHSGDCNGNKYNTYNPSYEEVLNVFKNYQPARPWLTKHIIKEKPMPLPECRLNEWACLIDNGINRDLMLPKGSISPFGSYGITGTDIAVDWFRALSDLNYKFKNIATEKLFMHSYFTAGGGHSATFYRPKRFYTFFNRWFKYNSTEKAAKKYYFGNFKS